MQYLIIALSTVGFCIGIVKFLPNLFSKFCRHSVKQLDILLDGQSDDEVKQGKLIENLKGLMSSFMGLLVMLAVIVVICIIPIILYGKFSNTEVDTSSIYFYLSMVVGSLILLKKPNQESDYSYWSKLIHYLSLDNYNLSKKLFWRETKSIDRTDENVKEFFVIVTGLARAGTTALTTALFKTQKFHSLSYANMPFLLSPNLWSKFYKVKDTTEKQRAHGDKVMVSKQSVEALEEFFFKAFMNDDFISDDQLELHQIDDEVYNAYLKYQRNIGNKSKDTVYLAKNNNLILRYESLRKRNQEFKSVFLFRDPLIHADSLLKQHLNFIDQQGKDTFVKDYMTWLGHYEFGEDQKVFNLGLKDEWSQYDKTSINYWLAIWLNYYNYLLNLTPSKNMFLCSYEEFLNEPNSFLKNVFSEIGIDGDFEQVEKFIPKSKNIEHQDLDKSLLVKAQELHSKLNGLSKKL